MSMRIGAGRPDVVVVALGGTRAFDVGPETAPRLTALAAESLVFSEATSTSPWELPSAASLLTGAMPSRHGAHERSGALAADGVPTLAEVLAGIGYATVAVSADESVGARTGLVRGYQQVVQVGTPPTQPEAQARRGLFRRKAETAAPATDVAAALGAVMRDAAADTPLHVLAMIAEPSLPYARGDADIDQDPMRHMTGAVFHTDEDWQLLRQLYRSEIRSADAQLGRILDALRDNTLLIVTSLHGENVGEHGLMGHQWSLNDTVLRVPLLVRLPGTTQAQQRDDLAQLIDVLPTVCDVVGAPVPAGVQGQSLMQALDRTHAVAEYIAPHPQLNELMRTHPHFDWSPYDRGLRSIRTRERKYIAASDGGNELYDLTTDPWERDNLYGRHPDEVSLARALRRWEQSEDAEPLSGVVPDQAVSERLRALGYIE
jgi:arylsulfatase A-like enzyme